MLPTLILDIETRPMLAYIWQLKDQYVDVSQIKEDWSVIAWSAKWLNAPAKDIIYYDTRKMTEKQILAPLWNLLDAADIVITQNGQSFDGPKLNARFIMHGMKPPSPYRHLDTYRIVKRVAQFTSNKLEYLTDKLNTKYRKLKHSKFPGLSLWKECLKGNIAAWEEMKKYNIHDVLSTEEFYNKIKAWAPDTMPKPYNVPQRCNICTGKMERRGYHRTKVSVFQRYHCLTCGAWPIGEKI